MHVTVQVTTDESTPFQGVRSQVHGKVLVMALMLVVHSPEHFCCIFEAVQSAYPTLFRGGLGLAALDSVCTVGSGC